MTAVQRVSEKGVGTYIRDPKQVCRAARTKSIMLPSSMFGVDAGIIWDCSALLYSAVLCIALHWIALHCLHSFTLLRFPLLSFALLCMALHGFALLCFALHCIDLLCVALL